MESKIDFRNPHYKKIINSNSWFILKDEGLDKELLTLYEQKAEFEFHLKKTNMAIKLVNDELEKRYEKKI